MIGSANFELATRRFDRNPAERLLHQLLLLDMQRLSSERIHISSLWSSLCSWLLYHCVISWPHWSTRRITPVTVVVMLLSHCGEYMANGLTNAVRHEFVMIANDRQTFVAVRKHSRSFLWGFECYAGLTSGEWMANGLTNAIRHQFAMIAKWSPGSQSDRQTFVDVRKHSRYFMWCCEY